MSGPVFCGSTDDPTNILAQCERCRKWIPADKGKMFDLEMTDIWVCPPCLKLEKKDKKEREKARVALEVAETMMED